MTDFILKLLGARLESAGDIAGVRLMFHGGMGMGWFVLGVLVLGGLAWWLYQQSPVSLTPLRRRILTALRIIFLTLLLLLLLRRCCHSRWKAACAGRCSCWSITARPCRSRIRGFMRTT